VGVARVAIATAALCAGAARVGAQVDPLLMVKRASAGVASVDYRAHVLIVLDTSERMQWGYRARDDRAIDDLELRVSQAELDDRGRWSHDYYDPRDYSCQGEPYLGALGLPACVAGTTYRRLYVDLDPTRTHATEIVAVDESAGGAFTRFYDRSRLGAARRALLKAVGGNSRSTRFGLLQTRHRLRAPVSTGIVLSARSDPDPARDQALLTDDPPTGRWSIGRRHGEVDNSAVDERAAPLVRADDPGANGAVVSWLQRDPDAGLAGAGNDTGAVEDAPLETLLSDARAEAERLIEADDRCRNTIVVLLTGGREGTGGRSPGAATTALAFRSIRGRRVPIHVIGIEPSSGADADREATDAELRAIADASGGRYTRVSAAGIEMAARAGVPVPTLVRAIHEAVQHGYAEPADVNAAPTPTPVGPKTEVQVSSPVVGTVSLAGARFADGTPVPATEGRITTATGAEVPQRSNLLVTSGFSLPGFGAVLRGFRVYRPVPDASRPSGYAFVADGRLLWEVRPPMTADGTSVDGSRRNIFTALADGTVVPLSEANWSLLHQAMRLPPDQRAVQQAIHDIRARAIGPIVSSTPAILDPPSLDPPDEEYVAFAEGLARRRTLVFVGSNDGMLHAIDGRTGLEVWAFVPYNLLPKLDELRNGLGVDGFVYTMDGSPTLADVKLGAPGDRRWRTLLVVGEGAGGTFYQAFDVTLDEDAACASADEDASESRLLGCFSRPSRIPLAWAFPRYAHFDPSASTWGDLGAGATAVEKTVGQTWSTPAIAQVHDREGPYAVLTGSGFLSHTAEQSAGRGGTVAGTSFYLLDVHDGSVSDWTEVGSDGRAEVVDDCAVAPPGGCAAMKNALQAGPTAAGAPGSRVVTKAYLGDLDGTIWRFDLGLEGGRATLGPRPASVFEAGPGQPIVGSIATLNVGTRQYLYFGGGSDLVPPQGGAAPYRLYGLLEGHRVPILAHDLARAPDDDERLTGAPRVAGDIVFFGTTSAKPGTPCARPDASLYAFTYVGGVAYDSTGDDAVTPGDDPRVVRLSSAGRATAPFVADRHLWFGVGADVTSLGDPRGFNSGLGPGVVRVLSWRQVR
jgi:hypothetical protein